MINILIPTQPDDTHAMFVQAALKKKGHRPVLWYTSDFPIQQFHSLELINNKASWYAYGVNFEIKNHEFDVVWYRRPHKPVLIDNVHPEDMNNAQKECYMFYQTFWEVIAPNAMWVNSPDKAKAANSKFLQLKIASEIGLKTPNTLISNDYKKIKKFIEENKCSGVIYKPLAPMIWNNKNGIRLTYTKNISILELPSEAILTMTPGIFQERIKKLYELRITYFGSYPVAVKLKSQEHPRGEMDWRYIPTHELLIEEHLIPSVIDMQCRKFMKELGIIFGCFDFIVTPNGDYYFLEVNESGQFLWIEDINPKIKMLDIFTEFLINKNPNFYYKNKEQHYTSLSEFKKEVAEVRKKALELHIQSEN